HEVARHQELHRLGRADQPGQEVRAAVARHQADPDVTLREPGRPGGEPHVTHERHVHPGAHRHPVHRGDQRLLQVLDRPRHLVDPVGQHALALDRGRLDLVERLQVDAAAEAVAGAGQHDHPDVLVLLCITQRLRPGVDHRPGERPQIARAVQPDHRHAAVDLVDQLVLSHRSLLSLRDISPSFSRGPPPPRARSGASSTVSLMTTFRPQAAPTVLDLLTLEKLEEDLYRGTTVFEEPFPLYGGQVAAQALAAAGDTVPADRLPHSLHGYYLRSGDAARPTVFRVHRDRDGRSYSARRVVAIQKGEVIFNMSASFHVPESGPDVQIHPAPDTPGPDGLEPVQLPRLFSMESRLPPQPYPAAEWPTRFWARCTQDLPGGQLLHACVLTYLSDISSGVTGIADGE